MSTNINSAWKISSNNSVFELVELAHAIKSQQIQTAPKEYANSITWVYTPECIRHLYEAYKDIPDEAATIIESAISPIFFKHWDSPIWAFPGKETEYLHEKLQQHAETLQTPCNTEILDEMATVARCLFEVISRGQPTLTFLGDRLGNVYVKGFSLTDDCEKMLDAKYPRFEYTNATEMSESDFPELKDMLSAASEEEKQSILSEAQDKRGQVWDQILNGKSTFRDAGMSFQLISNDCNGRTEWRKLIRSVIREAFVIWQKNIEK